ncbi:MAG: peptidase, partial [Planctomycetales bacterium 12-60-4]
VLLVIGQGAVLEGAAPRLSQIVPRGAQRGTEVEVTLRGERLDDVQQLMVYEPGIEVLELAATNDKELKCKFKIETGCVLGTKHIRVRTATGMSDLRTFRVGALPEITETEPNSEFATPQAVPMNVVVNGTIGNEDVDYFVVEAKKGDRITAEVEAIRLGDSMFDAFVAILNSARFELSTSDDAALVYQDGIASIIAPEDGNYIVQVRESSYGGGNHYRCHIGTFPRPRAIIPAGGQPGTALQVAFHGDVAGTFSKDIQVPADIPWEYAVLAEDERGISPSGLPFRISDLPNVIEQEPNNDVAAATAASAPAAFNGLIGEPSDIDYFKFEAKKGQVLDIRMYGRQLRSELDSVMTVHNANGGGIASNDDTGGPDSYIRFNPPADGQYLVSVRDHLNRGGSSYHYRVELTPVVPKLELSINEFDRYQEPKLVVPQGNRFAMLVAATRRDFGGPLEFLG